MLDATRAYGLDFIFPERDTAVGASLKGFGEFARAESDLISEYLAVGNGGLVDVGANIGAVCLPVAKRHPDRPVLAIEAHRGLAQILSANAFGNRLHNVQVLNAAAGSGRGIIDFPSAPLNAAGNFGTLAVSQATGETAQATLMLPLDELVPSDTAFIKIDVEGFEAEVLKGADGTLAETKPVWLIEISHMNKPASRATITTMRNAGYSPHWLYSPFVMAQPLKHSSQTPPNKGDYSVLALPPGAPNLWDLPAIEGETPEWPTSRKAFSFFSRYGY